jgi:hypothetical protein
MATWRVDPLGPGLIAVETRIAGRRDWMLFGIFMDTADGLKLAELRVYPAGPARQWERTKPDPQANPFTSQDPGTWSRDPSELAQLRAPSEIIDQALRQAGRDLPRLRRAALRGLRQLQGRATADAHDQAIGPAYQAGAHRLLAHHPGDGTPSGRPSTAQLHNLQVARAYVRAVRRGAHAPLDAVTEELGLRRGRQGEPAEARDRVREARRQDFLTKAGNGRSGGTLTVEGQRLARRWLRKEG